MYVNRIFQQRRQEYVFKYKPSSSACHLKAFLNPIPWILKKKKKVFFLFKLKSKKVV